MFRSASSVVLSFFLFFSLTPSRRSTEPPIVFTAEQRERLDREMESGRSARAQDSRAPAAAEELDPIQRFLSGGAAGKKGTAAPKKPLIEEL